MHQECLERPASSLEGRQTLDRIPGSFSKGRTIICGREEKGEGREKEEKKDGKKVNGTEEEMKRRKERQEEQRKPKREMTICRHPQPRLVESRPAGRKGYTGTTIDNVPLKYAVLWLRVTTCRRLASLLILRTDF